MTPQLLDPAEIERLERERAEAERELERAGRAARAALESLERAASLVARRSGEWA